MKRALIAATLLCATDGAIAGSFDLKKLQEFSPCKSAAIRLCDRSQGISIAALWKCGNTLAARQQEISERRAAVLKRYGLASVDWSP